MMAAGGVLTVCTWAAAAGTGSPAPVATGPLSYFAAKCARCHGPFGSFYGDDFGGKLSDAKLRQVVREMAQGPARAPLGGTDLDALTAFHRALIARQPFVAWTGADAARLVGEATPDATVRVRFGGRETTVTRDWVVWTAAIPPGHVPAEAVVEAMLQDATTTLALSRQPFSHYTAAPR